MTAIKEDIISEALALPPMKRAELIEILASSFESPYRKALDALWAEEAERRIDAFESGEIGSRPASEVFESIEENMRSGY